MQIIYSLEENFGQIVLSDWQFYLSQDIGQWQGYVDRVLKIWDSAHTFVLVCFDKFKSTRLYIAQY